jgi:2-polyprenyl-3-methyl-5-hydroxy-6-metoxy-1,4-benzoquinol methylase
VPVTKTVEDAFWDEYLVWLDAEPPAGHPDELMERYLVHLVASHAPPTELSSAVDTIGYRLVSDPQGWRHVFNKIYQDPNPACSSGPNDFLVRVAGSLRPGKALDMCMGQGRNAIFLASSGWRVTGYDIADTGIATARENASRHGVRIDAMCCSNTEFTFPEETWDLIVATYCPLPLTPAFSFALRQSLRPGGQLLVETFAHSPLGPHRAGIELAAEDLIAAFPGLEVVHKEEITGIADWTGAESLLLRFLAERPAGERVSAAHPKNWTDAFGKGRAHDRH